MRHRSRKKIAAIEISILFELERLCILIYQVNASGVLLEVRVARQSFRARVYPQGDKDKYRTLRGTVYLYIKKWDTRSHLNQSTVY